MKSAVEGRRERVEGRFWSRKQKEVEGGRRRGIVISVWVWVAVGKIAVVC